MTKRRILIVEDDVPLSQCIALQLEEMGYEAAGCASDGEQAITLAADLRPDLVLVNIDLERSMGGIAAAQVMRNQMGLPMVFLTSQEADEILARAQLTEPYGYVLKPYAKRELRAVIDMALYKHQAETKTREAVEHSKAVLDKLFDGVITINDLGLMESVNQAACAIFGYRLSELMGHNVSMLMPEPERSQHDGYLKNYHDTGDAHVIGITREVTGMRKDGSIFPLALSVSRLQRSGRNIFIGTIRDITQQRHYAEELERNRHQLEALLAIRTTDLNSALRQADAISQAKSTFVAHMSHEIRTPMNAILGFTQLLRDELTAPQQIDRLHKIQSAGEHLLLVINDALDFAKIEAGRMELEITRFNLTEVLDNVLAIACESARGKEIQITLYADGLPHWLSGDATRLAQALLNYASNAVKFTESGTVVISAKVEQDSDHAVLLRFEVTDTGIGIAPEKLGNLFQPFEQANASTTRQYGGTGLGLAITRQLARLMGGESGARSMPCQGSTFWFTARLARATPPPVALPVAPEGGYPSPEEQLRHQFSAARILVVDDDMFNREVAAELIQNAGLTADMAEDGFDAVSKVQAGDYDLILMDIQMPVMDGLAASRSIRNLPGWAFKPIVALTAASFANDRQLCLDAGMNEVMAKPVAPKQLCLTLLKWLSQEK